MIHFSALSGSILRMIPRFAALAMAVATTPLFVGCVAETVDESAEIDADEEPGADEQGFSVRCRVCNPECYTDYCTPGVDYCDPEVGCVPYP